MPKFGGYLILIFMVILVVSLGSCSSLDQGKNPGTVTGTIYGYTYQLIGWQISPASFVLVKVDNRSKFSDINGYYEFPFLSLGKTYTVSVSKLMFIPQTYQVNLSYDNPCIQINFVLEYRDGMHFSLLKSICR